MNPKLMPILFRSWYSWRVMLETYNKITSLDATIPDAPMKADLSGMTVTNLVDGADIADDGTVTFASINGDKYYESYTPSVVTGTGSDITITNESGSTMDIHVIHLNSIGLQAITDVPTLTAMFPHYFDGTVHAGATRFTSKDEDGNIVSVSYIPPDIVLRRVPSARDTTERNSDGTQKKVQRVQAYTLQSADVLSMVIGLITDRATIQLPTDALQGAIDNTSIYIIGKTQTAYANRDDVAYIGQYFTHTLGRVYFIMTKGTSLADAQTALAGTVIYYQLATPIETTLPAVPALISKPNGTVIAEPCVCDEELYGTGITVSGYVFSEISKVVKVSTGADVTADCSLTVGADGFTCSSADAGDLLRYELLIDTSTVANTQKIYRLS